MNSITLNKLPLSFKALGLMLTMGVMPMEASAQQSAKTDAQIQSDAVLTDRQVGIVTISALAAMGDLERLEGALNTALANGLTVNDAKEVFVQLYAYAGFPRSLNALSILMSVANERKQAGLPLIEGNPPSEPIPTGDALLSKGTEVQTALVGRPVAGPLFDFAPVANEYLQTHLFGDIFARDNVSWQDREMATVSMLSAITGTESQRVAHINMSLNSGVSEAQLRAVIQVLGEQVNQTSADNTQKALDTFKAS